MKSDPKECLYCQNNETLHNLMIQPEKINYGAYSDKLSHLHFHLAPKYVDGPDYGGIFQMNPGKVYLTDAEYQELIDAVKANL